MRRLALTGLAIFFACFLFAQKDSVLKVTTAVKSKNHANDHFMIQIGKNTWTSKPDSIHTTGFPRTFNFYIMLAFPFKSNAHLSVAIGPGIATDNINLSKTYVGLRDNTTTLRFQDLSDTSHFKKYKLSTAYLEAPLELRYQFNPDNDAKTVKIALGIKLGYLINAHTKGSSYVDRNGNIIFTDVEKIKDSKYLNSTRVSGMVRIGFGHFSVYGSWSFTGLIKDGAGPQVKPLSIGISLSGL